jgi:hypothetical protein
MARPARGSPEDGGRTAARAPFFFEGIESPNGTIFPDALLDQVMPFLSPTEWKVCSYVVRRTFGWKKSSDRISLEQICHGIVRRDGSRLDHGTQLDRKTAIKALRALEAKGVLVAQRNYSDARGFEATTYGLRFRGQPPTQTLGELFPQGTSTPGEFLHQPQREAFPQVPGARFHQASGESPPALVASGHPQPTPGTTFPVTDEQSDEVAPETPPLGNGLPPPLLQAAGPAASAGDLALWSAVLARLAQQMTPANYQTWLADTRPLGRRGGTLVVGAPSAFVREWLQTRFRALVRRALLEAAPDLRDVTFTVAAEPDGAP